MTLEQLIPLIAGPGGALAVCVLVGWGVYRMLVHYFVPMLQGSIDRHLAQVDEMNTRHTAEHERIIGAINDLDTGCHYRAAK